MVPQRRRGKYRCQHGIYKTDCKECGNYCKHNKRRRDCKECVGGYYCEHKIRNMTVRNVQVDVIVSMRDGKANVRNEKVVPFVSMGT